MPPPPPSQDAEAQDSSEGEDWDQQPWEVNVSSSTATRLFSTSYSTYEAIQDDLRAFCEENHTGLVVRSSWKNKAKTAVVKAMFCCDRSRQNLRPSVATKYSTSTTKTSLHCPFRIILQALVSNGGQWTARLVEGRHEGHGPSTSPQEHRVLRRLTDEQLEFAVGLCTDQSITTRSIYKQLQQRWPDILYRLQDLYSLRRSVNKQRRDGYLPVQQFIRSLSERPNRLCLLADWEDQDQTRFRQVTWLYQENLRAWKRSPFCIQLDATYNTNCYKMPLMSAVVVTPERTSMPILFGLLHSEQEVDFCWFMHRLKELQQRYTVSTPDVFVTDFDQQLRTAVKTAFPDAQLQLCVFHVNSNVTLAIKQRWIKRYTQLYFDSDEEADPDEEAERADLEELEASNRKTSLLLTTFPNNIAITRAGLFHVWRYLVFTPAEEEFDKAWNYLQTEFKTQTRILSYLRDTYLPLKREWAVCYTRYNHNLGLTSTAPVESSHGSLKTYNLSRRTDLDQLEEATVNQTLDKYRKYKDKMTESSSLVRQKYLGKEWLGDLPLAISRWGLDRLDVIHQKALKSLEDKAQGLGSCTGSTRIQYGLPCAHELVEFMKVNKALTKADVSSFWWLKQEIKDPYTALKPPPLGISKGRPATEGGPFGQEAIHKVPRPKGRTKTGIPDAGRRNYSQFELGESPEAQDAVVKAEQRRAKRAKVQRTEDEEEDQNFATEVEACVEKARQRQRQRPVREQERKRVQELVADTIVVVIDSD